MKLKTIPLVFLLSFYACKEKKTTNENHLHYFHTENSYDHPTFLFPQLKKENGQSYHDIKIGIKNSLIKIGQVDNCSIISNDQYHLNQIPKAAFQACGGKSAHGYDYFYSLKNKSNSYSIFQGRCDRLTDPIIYKKIIAIHPNEQIEYPNRLDISGVYTLGRHKKSRILILEEQDNHYESLYCELKGILPPANYLDLHYDELSFQVFKNFSVDLYDNSIICDFGKGEILPDQNKYKIVFSDLKNDLNEPLVFSYNEKYQILLEH